MWWTHLVGQRALQTAALKLHKSAPVCANFFFLWRWLTFTAICQFLYHVLVSSSFVLALLPEHVARFQRAEIIPGSSGGLLKGRAGGLKSTWVYCFLRHTACLSGLQRVPSWFSSGQSVIILAGWLHYSMCISQHSQCFPCVVSFLLYSDSLKLCALQKQIKTWVTGLSLSSVSLHSYTVCFI